MKYFRSVAWLVILLVAGCQSVSHSLTILDGGRMRQLPKQGKTLAGNLKQSGLALGVNDRLFLDGSEVDSDAAPTGGTVQIRRAISMTLITPDGERLIETSALTVGQALMEAGVGLRQADRLSVPLESPIRAGMKVRLSPAREITIHADGEALGIRSAAETVGEALAEAGLGLSGLDSSFPAEEEAIPADGQIQVRRVREVVEVSVESVPFKEEIRTAAELPLGDEQVIQAGVAGIRLKRERIRFEDGVESSRTRVEEIRVQEPQTRIVQRGEKLVLTPVGGNSPYQYWYVTEMYATVYSPCSSGGGKCYYGTASGARAGYGVVAVDYSIYGYLAGMQVYIPGYGVATIGDTGGGPIIESALGVPRTKWIDLGFNDGEVVDMTGWVKVYFLAPVPNELPPFFR